MNRLARGPWHLLGAFPIDNHHRFDGKAQRPAKPDDYKNIWRVLAEYDQLKLGHLSQTGLPTLVAYKTINGEVYRAVFEVRSSQKNRSLVLLILAIKK